MRTRWSGPVRTVHPFRLRTTKGGISMLSPHPVAVTAPPRLCACGHALITHDVIATRYCMATTAHKLSRGCICKQP
jgi:hypothetical protein